MSHYHYCLSHWIQFQGELIGLLPRIVSLHSNEKQHTTVPAVTIFTVCTLDREVKEFLEVCIENDFLLITQSTQ